MNWKVDIGIDEINDDLFTMVVFDETGETICSVFGKSVEELEKRAALIAAAPDLLTCLKLSAKETIKCSGRHEYHSVTNLIDAEILIQRIN